MGALDAIGTIGGLAFLVWTAGRVVLWVVAQLAAPTPDEAARLRGGR